MSRRIAHWLIGIAIFNMLLPFVGPAVGFGMGPDPAFVITSGRVIRHVIPGAVIIIGAWLMLQGGSKARSGAVLALLGGGWIAIYPFMAQVESVSQFIRRTVYHSGTGLLLFALATYGLGAMTVSRLKARGDTEPERPRATV